MSSPWPAIIWIAVELAACALTVAAILVLARRNVWVGPPRRDDGIRIGSPKVYDNRTLSLMLEGLESQLRELQRLDAGSIHASLGTPQAAVTESRDVSITATVAAPGKDAPAAAATPGAPQLRERGGDLLNDQINLSYQIFSLRLLLERSISDRLYGPKSRLQAVVGFPISIDPPSYAAGCAATVEVKFAMIDRAARTRERAAREARPVADTEAQTVERKPSLIAVFPQEETYNTWSVDRRRSAIGASGQVPSAGSVGARVANASETSSMRRQSEIVAFERQPEETLGDEPATELILAWQFRPSAGQRSVAAGMRQVLALLALPNVDDASESGSFVPVWIDVRSAWQRWNRRSGTAERGAGRRLRVLFTDRPTWHDYSNLTLPIRVPTTDWFEAVMGPRIKRITWFRVGLSRATIIVEGKNFFTGSTVTIGDETVTPASGLTIKSERSMQLDVPLSALVYDAVLNGRYGRSIPLEAKPERTVPRLYIAWAWLDRKPGNASYDVIMNIGARERPTIDASEIEALGDSIFAINGKIVPAALSFDGSGKQYVVARTVVPADFVEGSTLSLGVRWPFLGPTCALTFQTYVSAPKLYARRSRTAAGTRIVIYGKEFSDEVAVMLDRLHRLADGGTLNRPFGDGMHQDVLLLDVDSGVADRFSELLVCEPNVATVAVPLPAGATLAAYIDTNAAPPAIDVAATSRIVFTGLELDDVIAVRYGDVAFEFVVYDRGTNMAVVVDGTALGGAGKKTFEFETSAGTVLTADVIALAATKAPATSSPDVRPA